MIKFNNVQPGDLLNKTFASGESVYYLVKNKGLNHVKCYFILWKKYKDLKNPHRSYSEHYTEYDIIPIEHFSSKLPSIKLLCRVK